MEVAKQRWKVQIVIADLIQEVRDALDSTADWVQDEETTTAPTCHLRLIPGGMQ